jgi:N-methylhydantoinase A
MRYRGQGGETPTAWSATADRLEAAFASTHQALYGFTLDAQVECVTLRVEAVGHVADAPGQRVPAGGGATPVALRSMWVDGGWRDVPLYDRATFGAGDRLDGPAVITQLDSTTLVAPGWSVTVHETGALVMERP